MAGLRCIVVVLVISASGGGSGGFTKGAIPMMVIVGTAISVVF